MRQRELTPKVNKTKGDVLDVTCIECGRTTKHRVLASFDQNGSEWDQQEGWGVDWIDNYQVIQCQGCETISFRHLHWDDVSYQPEWGDDGSTEYLYPKRNTNALVAKPMYNVPQSLRRLYIEVIDSFNNGSSTLCAGGLRALVEGICSDKGIKNGPVTVKTTSGAKKVIHKRNLEGKISGLVEKGFLSPSGAQTLHEHRFIGNEALHELARPGEDELKLAIEIIEHTLEHIYEIPHKHKAMRHSKASRKK